MTLTVNGRTVGTQTPDAVRTVVWKNVPLQAGGNRVELRAGDLVSTSVWIRRTAETDPR